ncbi:energy-coupling factor ABC transporter permease [Pseudoalteromonas luteoviolacea]|uniref:Uncharacterized protein n=1 Tax=Pseudoalteromonas luteoviolacea NCIMB 1942 TaxID=1365253 RepID=A0A167H9H3_9GAMM|nr:energy-coupling factor ABC transporter permease [Pseudoalteromonas luteoviolacea]KZN57785.1 hypothetical protein N482_04600 [Pseudoalteromonas luteoviolacea NCIMB 1942]KZW99851.1 hypothetical protein JL49_14555 [Pseudoalteromonas luteoviolacea]
MTTFVFAILAFLLSLDKQQYETLIKTPQRQIGVLSCALVMALLWQIKAGILPNLNIHILAVTTVTLVLGWRLSLLSTLLAAILCYFFASFEVSFFSFWLLNGILPVYLSYALFVLCYHYLPRHFFIYIFVCAFISAGLVAAIKIILSATYYWSVGQYDWYVLTDNYMFYAVIMWFPEAMLNGMAVTLLITYRPQWVRTFYDKEYLDR